MKPLYCARLVGVLLFTAVCQAIVPPATASATLAQTSQSNRSAPPAAAVVKTRPIVVKPGHAPTINDDCPTLPDAQVRNFSCSEAAELIERLKDAQAKLRNGEKLYFALFSGAPASDPMTKVSPREAFMRMPFEKAFIIERTRTDNLLWQPHKFAYRPAGAGQMIWDVEVVSGFSDKRLLQVKMLYGPPPPF